MSTFLEFIVHASYNADFDGDEMNLHVPQSLEAEQKQKNDAHTVHDRLAASNAPVMKIVQDSCLGRPDHQRTYS